MSDQTDKPPSGGQPPTKQYVTLRQLRLGLREMLSAVEEALGETADEPADERKKVMHRTLVWISAHPGCPAEVRLIAADAGGLSDVYADTSRWVCGSGEDDPELKRLGLPQSWNRGCDYALKIVPDGLTSHASEVVQRYMELRNAYIAGAEAGSPDKYQRAVWFLQDIAALAGSTKRKQAGCEIAAHALAQLGESRSSEEPLEARASNQYVGIDYGKPGGDMTGITARCPKCQRIYSMCFEPGAIVLVPVELQCICGTVTDLRPAAETSALPDQLLDVNAICAQRDHLLGLLAIADHLIQQAPVHHYGKSYVEWRNARDRYYREWRQSSEKTSAPLTGVEFLQTWMRTPNPMLGDIAPLSMLKMGNGQRLAQFIEQAYEAEMPPPERPRE